MINVDVNSFNKMGSVFYAALNFYFNLFHRLKELTFLERGAHFGPSTRRRTFCNRRRTMGEPSYHGDPNPHRETTPVRLARPG